jgi:hypothetical protein
MKRPAALRKPASKKSKAETGKEKEKEVEQEGEEEEPKEEDEEQEEKGKITSHPESLEGPPGLFGAGLQAQ